MKIIAKFVTKLAVFDYVADRHKKSVNRFLFWYDTNDDSAILIAGINEINRHQNLYELS